MFNVKATNIDISLRGYCTGSIMILRYKNFHFHIKSLQDRIQKTEYDKMEIACMSFSLRVLQQLLLIFARPLAKTIYSGDFFTFLSLDELK